MGLRPVPAGAELPSIHDIADEIDRVGIDIAQKVEQEGRLASLVPRCRSDRNSVRTRMVDSGSVTPAPPAPCNRLMAAQSQIAFRSQFDDGRGNHLAASRPGGAGYGPAARLACGPRIRKSFCFSVQFFPFSIPRPGRITAAKVTARACLGVRGSARQRRGMAAMDGSAGQSAGERRRCPAGRP